MKFQNPSLNFILNGRTHTRTHARTSRNQYAPHFFKVGGIKIFANKTTTEMFLLLLFLAMTTKKWAK